MSAGIYIAASMAIVGGVLGSYVGVHLMDCMARPFERRRQINLATTREATHSVRMKTVDQLFPKKKYQVKEKENGPIKEAVADEEKGTATFVATAASINKNKKDVIVAAGRGSPEEDTSSALKKDQEGTAGDDDSKKKKVAATDDGDDDDHEEDIAASPAPTVNEEEDLGEVCAICLEPFQRDEMVMEGLECHHEYHRTCMMEWLHKHNDCPVCRERMWTREAFVAAKKKVFKENPALLKTEMAAAQAVEETMEAAAAVVAVEDGDDTSDGNDGADGVNKEDYDEENPNTTTATTTSSSPSASNVL